MAQSQEKKNITGKIKSVTCRHFVTYDLCTFHPTEYLNVIIGPNGTGKSTLVAAIVLGLGGNAKLLSRATSVQDYIKNGKDTATVTIEIYANDSGKTHFFQRSFDSSGNSEFMINEEIITIKSYLKAVSAFNIQINNLCQFLPQDRVQDFAKMNPQEILCNTIISVCSQEVNDNFVKLKELRKQQLTSKKNLPSDLQQLKESMARNDELKKILERVNVKKQLFENLNIFYAKKAWMEVSELKEKIDEIKNNLSSANKIAQQHSKKYESMMKTQNGVVSRTNQLVADVHKQDSKVTVISEKFDKIIESIEQSEGNIRKSKHEFEIKKRENSDRRHDLQNEIRVLEAMLHDLTTSTDKGTELETVARSQTINENLNRLKVEISSLIARRTNINKQLDEVYIADIQMMKSRIERLENVTEQKLQLLRNKFNDVYKAVIWLRENKNLFRGRVYEPRILELNVQDANYAKYFENTLPLKDLLVFTFEDKSDMSKFINHLCIEQKLEVHANYSEPANTCNYVPSEPILHYRKFGFFAYLIELIEGPPAILNSLCSLFHLEKILVGTDQVNTCTDKIPNHIRTFFGGDQRYNVTISKYSNEPLVMQSKIKSKGLLSSVDVNELNNFKKRLNEKVHQADILKNERTSIEAKAKELEEERSDAMKEKRALEANALRIKQLKEQFKKQSHKVDQLKQSTLDIQVLEEMFLSTAKRYVKDIITLQKTKVKALLEYQSASAEKTCSASRVNIYKQENEELTRTIKNAADTLRDAKKLVETISCSLEIAQTKYRTKLTQAKGLTNGLSPTDSKFPYTRNFAELPNNLDELKELINETGARLDCMDDTDQDVLQEYESRCEEIESLKKSIDETHNKDNKFETEMNNIFTGWYQEVCRVVEILNSKFGSFMKSMDYVGEVSLTRKEELDFDLYGIQIMVQYRNNVALQALDRYVQSGGERAVAIAVYTLSLQHLTHVPFRCVDEINQGMDPRNERKIFEMLVDETTQSGSSQYFFVTPKLLPDLKYNDRMAVNIVYNGKLVKQKDAFTFCI